jgi:DNA-binding NarL/FixJ family response regulator
MLTASSPDVRIIILSMHTDEEFVISAIQAGVKGYLSKDASKEELLEAIKIIHEGGECYSKMISDSFLKSYARKYKAEQSLVENKTLTQREMEILKLAAVGQSNKEIADRLFISHKTVDCHKNNIVQKLKLKNTAEMVLYAVKNKIIEV